MDAESQLTSLKPLQQALVAEMQTMRSDISGELAKGLTKVRGDFSGELAKMRTDIGRLRKGVDGIQRGLGSMLESQARLGVAKQFGERYSRQLTALSVQDLVRPAAGRSDI